MYIDNQNNQNHFMALLSSQLHDLIRARRQVEKRDSIYDAMTTGNFSRLNMLIKSDIARSKESILIKRWLKEHLKSNRDKVFLAIEYVIDDGGSLFEPGCGDILLYNKTSDTIEVVEVKRISATTPFPHAERKKDMVYRQSLRYSARLRSWLNHLQGDWCENKGHIAHDVEAYMLIEDGRRGLTYKKTLEMSGIEPETLPS